ncbi:hydrolase [Paenibacillus swuensis]|uniref:Hydrolase n=1 Tax=Paenibacillus swuensis TaxID=1178515 RepID=A0A172TE48_9BACL|nr:metal-dependent hydrolase [Paenibacillus swuensis]ANE45073.1 hydrolase [Paenibacillus swuensis]
MDTGTHLVIGLGLAGLAHIDPVVASDSTLATAVFIGTVLGQQAPDADTLIRFRGNAAYIKNHRGKSHSLPAVALWTLLITGLISLFFPAASVAHLMLWVFIAVALHVFIDCFNTYGTQAAYPLTEKWISWNIIHIFDPFIFVAHVIAILFWTFSLTKPEFIFTALYIIIAGYYLWRTFVHFWLQRSLPKHDPEYKTGETYYAIPTVKYNAWNVVKRIDSRSYRIGDFSGGTLRWLDQATCSDHPAAELSKQSQEIGAFTYFSSFACADVKEHKWGYEVRWVDVRYRHRKQYPFVGVILMNTEYKVLDAYVGWLSDERLEKRLRMDSY